MAAKHTHDIVIKVGEYTDRAGQPKARTKNIGALYTKEDGNMFLAIDSTVIAMETQYVANKDRADRMMVSVYPVREENERRGSSPSAPAKSAAPASARHDADDDIPF